MGCPGHKGKNAYPQRSVFNPSEQSLRFGQVPSTITTNSVCGWEAYEALVLTVPTGW